MTNWSLEEYCSTQKEIDVTSLPSSTQQFLELLSLPSIHPFCSSPNNDDAPTFPVEGVPSMGRLDNVIFGGDDTSFVESLITVWYMVAPPLLAMAELWLRLFAGLLGPIGIMFLLWKEYQSSSTTISSGKETKSSMSSSSSRNQSSEETTTRKTTKILSLVCIVTVASTVVLMTDTLYVLENGTQFGVWMFIVSVIVSLRTCFRFHLPFTSVGIALLVLLASNLVYDTATNQVTFGNKVDEVRTIQEGLYFDNSNTYIQSIVDNWPEKYRTYNKENGATTWMPTGDSRTGLPFLLNHLDNPEKKRVFLPTGDDDQEYVALDIAFPSGGHNFTSPVYLVFHGLNGGSNEEYIRDLTYRRLEEGSTVVVMIARGLMDLPIRGWGGFNGARTSDAHAAAVAVKRTLVAGSDQVVVGVGYSMGAIILSNYVASYGADCALDGAIAISGGLDMRYQKHFYRAQRLWQPMLTEELRNEFLLGKWGYRVKERLSQYELLRTLRASHITEIDEYAVVPMNGFDNLDHYYVSMSALGDIPHTPGPEELLETTTTGKINNVAIPFCVLHALDDPLITWRTVANNDGPMHPNNLSRTGKGNLMLLLTKGGGHVGWPLGLFPFLEQWRWMSDAAMSFAHAVDKANKQKIGSERN